MPLSIAETPSPATCGYALARMIAGISAPIDATPVIDTETLRG